MTSVLVGGCSFSADSMGAWPSFLGEVLPGIRVVNTATSGSGNRLIAHRLITEAHTMIAKGERPIVIMQVSSPFRMDFVINHSTPGFEEICETDAIAEQKSGGGTLWTTPDGRDEMSYWMMSSANTFGVPSVKRLYDAVSYNTALENGWEATFAAILLVQGFCVSRSLPLIIIQWMDEIDQFLRAGRHERYHAGRTFELIDLKDFWFHGNKYGGMTEWGIDHGLPFLSDGHPTVEMHKVFAASVVAPLIAERIGQ